MDKQQLQQIQQLYQQQNWQALEQLCSEGLKCFPNSDSTYYFRAIARASLGRFEEAKKDLEKCLEIRADNKEAQLSLQQIEQRIKALATSKAPEYIARYKILCELGTGAMGKVYKAHDPQIDRIVAIKVVLHPSAKARQRFLLEAKTMAQFDHANIVRLYEVATDVTGRDYIVMEFIEGEDLANRELSPHQALTIIKEAALAVDYAHQKGIIHRDLKPSNLMLSKEGKVIVMDFGIAKDLKSVDITLSGMLIGTPLYMAPEQAASKRKSMCPQTDVYALGAILYKLIVGVPAVEGKTIAQILYNVLHSEIISIRKHKPQLAIELDIICARAMAKEIDQRYSSARALADDINRFMQGEIIQAQAFPLWYRAHKKIKKNKVIITTIILLFILVVGGLWAFDFGKHIFSSRQTYFFSSAIIFFPAAIIFFLFGNHIFSPDEKKHP